MLPIRPTAQQSSEEGGGVARSGSGSERARDLRPQPPCRAAHATSSLITTLPRFRATAKRAFAIPGNHR